jgi:hypothetical protein
MKKINLIAAMLLVVMNISASSYIGLDADTVRINPNRLTGYWQTDVVASIEGYADTWQVSVSYPGGVIPKLVAGITPLEGMTVGYTDPTGSMVTYEAPLQVSAMYETLSSTTAGVYGYWDYNYDGTMETYGSIKWEPGKHRMWQFNLYIPADFRSGYIIFDGTINSGFDSRGPILSNVKSFKRTWLWVGYEAGDADGNSIHDVGDMSLVIAYILGKIQLDEFRVAAADANCDGMVDVDDVSMIINMALR